MFFNVYLTTKYPSDYWCFVSEESVSPAYLRAWYETTHTFIFSVSSSMFLPCDLFFCCLFLNIYLLFSPHRALCALWCWFLQLSTHQYCHLYFIGASSWEHIRNVIISVWLIVIASITPLIPLVTGLPGACVWAIVFTLHLHVSLVNFPFFSRQTPYIISSFNIITCIYIFSPFG